MHFDLRPWTVCDVNALAHLDAAGACGLVTVAGNNFSPAVAAGGNGHRLDDGQGVGAGHPACLAADLRGPPGRKGMLKTRHDHEYQARVWMQKTLVRQVYDETLTRIEALLPYGYRYRVEQVTEQDGDGMARKGWRGSFGDGDGSGWSVPHLFKTEVAAAVALLALLCDECVFPGCSTSCLAAADEKRT